MFDSGLRQNDEPSPPPTQSHILNGAAIKNRSSSQTSDSPKARNRLAESVAPRGNRRMVRPSLPPLTSHTGFPLPREGTCNSSSVKAVSGAPSIPLPDSVLHLGGDSPKSKLSQQQMSSGSGTLAQYLHDPGLCGDAAIADVLPYDPPSIKPPSPLCPGSRAREPLSTSLLPPRTHKLSCGQLVILPSASVLIDFREGERRKGKKGDQVMVVSPNGDQIHLYSAPHLSTPCCLAEPIVTLSLNELPADSYKLYEQAKNVIEHIKRNVPKVVMYEGTFVCTLMANEPRADIEIRTNPRSTPAAISTSTTAIRIRFSRKSRTMQIHSSEPSLCKKTMFCTARGVPADAGDWASLSKNEKECLAALLDFLRVVEAVEGLPRNASEPLIAVTTDRLPKDSTKREATHSVPAEVSPQSDAYPSGAKLPRPAVTPTVPLPPATVPPPPSRSTHITVSPRPRFPSALPRASSNTFRKTSSTAVCDESPPGDPPSSSATRVKNVESLRELSGGSRLQTRFMPGVGWCVRSVEARYRIMFTDGVTLEVDVDEEWVEMVERDGSVFRYSVRDCSTSRKVGDRMKIFQEFLPLFDD